MDAMKMLDVAHERAACVVAKVEPHQYGLPTPCAGWDVRTCLNKLITSTRFWAVAVAEGRVDETLDLAHPPDLIGSDPERSYAAAAAACRAAFELPGALTRVIPSPVPGVQLSGEQMLGVRIFDTTVITWDVARSIGVPPGVDDEQASLALEVASAVVPIVARAEDHTRFQPAQPAPAHADALYRLVALTGRDPNWQPA